MWALAGILIAGIFLLGIGAALFLTVRLLLHLFAPPDGSSHKTPGRPAVNREADMNLVAREILRAFAAGKLSASARDEVLAYCEAVKDEERRKRTPHPTVEPPPKPEVRVISVPAGASMAQRPPTAPLPTQQPIQLRDPAEIRAAMARLHQHAAAPLEVENEVAHTPAAPPVRQTPPAPEPQVVASPSASVPTTPARSWTERLFTPENVRILQSLGIGLIFFSAVAYVRTQMWDAASAPTQMLMLLGGTATCLGLGFALRRWTDLRITGLGFLILGHLSMVIDASAALIPSASTEQPLYTFQPGSLWTVTLLLFSASSFWHARALKEPLFEAFTFFGAMAAWGAGAQWLDVSPWHLAIAYLPAILACRFIYPRLDLSNTPRRWSLAWWLRAAWVQGAPLLLLVELTVCSLMGAGVLHHELGRHLSALSALGLAMLWDTRTSPRGPMVHFAALALLSLAPLAAFASVWPVWTYPMTLALPAAGLSLAALAWQTWGNVKDREATERLLEWGLTVVCVAAAAALLARLLETEAAASTAWSAGALLAVGAGLLLGRSSVTGAWLALAGTVLLSTMVFDLTGLGFHWLPLLGLGFASVQELWALRAGKHPLAQIAREQADALALAATIAAAYYLVLAQPHAVWAFTSSAHGLYSPAPLYQFLTVSALAAMALLTAALRHTTERCLTGVALLGPALLYGMSACGMQTGSPALWSIALAGIVCLLLETLARKDVYQELLNAGRSGIGLLILQGLLLSCLDLARLDYTVAAWDFFFLGLLAAVIAVRSRRTNTDHEICVVLESATLGLLCGAAFCTVAAWQLPYAAWVSLYPLLAGLVLLMSLLGERAGPSASQEHPFRTAGEWIALFMGAAGLVTHLFLSDRLPSYPLHLLWIAVLPMFFIALRHRWTRVVSPPIVRDAPQTAIVAGLQILLTFMLCIGLTLYHEFWLSTTPAVVRAECATFYGLMLLLSIALGVWLRSAFAPVMGGFAALALSACAYGGWGLSYMTFGLPAMLTALLLLGLAYGLKRQAGCQHPGMILSARLVGGLCALLAAGFLLGALALGPKDSHQAASVAAWLLASLALWYAGRGQPSFLCGFGCNLTLLLAGMHGLRWAAFEFTAMGPAIGVFALVTLALREAIEFFEMADGERKAVLHGRAGGFLGAAFGTMLLSGLFGLAGHFDDRPWHWIATLCEGALFLGALTVLSRRRKHDTHGGVLMTLELGVWLALLMALGFGVDALGYSDLLHGAVWALLGALVLLTGMMLETVSGGVIGPAARSRVPGAFLESRHVVAAGCGALALLTALIEPHTIEHVWMTGIWQACLGTALLALYGSLARTSVSEGACRTVRYGSALTAYVVLLPLGYLAFLKSQSTGDSWGALWFLALAPVLLGVAWLLEQEREHAQAEVARFGALLVSVGALLLAWAANNAHLAEVPAWTCFGLMLEALLMRRWSQRKEWTLVALAALSGACFYTMRALRHDPAWGMPEAWVWEGTVMAALGLLMTSVGGAFRLERDDRGRSLVGQAGLLLSLLSLGLMLVGLLLHGTSAAYLGADNLARLDAFNVALLLGAATSLAAWYGLHLKAGCLLAPLQLLAAYGLSLWAWHITEWEYYTVPIALCCFFWAIQSERIGKGRTEPAPRIWQVLGTALLLVPSFVQAMPYTTSSAWHFFALAFLALLLVGGAMWTRRKVPLLGASSALLLCTIIKTAQWAAHHNATLPAAGFGLGVAVLAIGCLFESRMNRMVRTAADQVKAQARMFWTSWD